MIYVKFKLDRKLKKIISSNKNYSLQEASIALLKAQTYAKDNNYEGVIEYSILEDKNLLFRNNYSLQKEEHTNIILLVRDTLNTLFPDHPEIEKQLLLEKLSKSLAENMSANEVKPQREFEKELKEEPIPNQVAVEEELQEELIPNQVAVEEELKEELIPNEVAVEEELQEELIPNEVAVEEELQEELIPNQVAVEEELKRRADT
ncbi:hypothetical protein Q5M85_08920 [Paraclostridium bifermentans]|nr:hypothetical protein [Paraclostridium bifermentans]